VDACLAHQEDLEAAFIRLFIPIREELESLAGETTPRG